MRKVLLIILSFAFVPAVLADAPSTSKPSQENLERFSDDNVPFIYESRAKLPVANEKLAEYISADYREARDEFTKHEMMEKILPVIQSTLAEAKATSQYTMRLGLQLGDYDFSKKSFPTGISSDSYIAFNVQKYGVIFENGNELKNLPLSLEDAKALSGKLQNDRSVVALLRCKVVGTQEKKVSIWNMKLIKVKVEKAVFLSDEVPFATIESKL